MEKEIEKTIETLGSKHLDSDIESKALLRIIALELAGICDKLESLEEIGKEIEKMKKEEKKHAPFKL